jgi:hypothetical protein
MQHDTIHRSEAVAKLMKARHVAKMFAGQDSQAAERADENLMEAELTMDCFTPSAKRDIVPVPKAISQCPIFRVDDNPAERITADYDVMAGVRVHYDGPPLNVYDSITFYAALSVTSARPIGESILTTRRALLQLAGRSDNAASYARLQESLNRLAHAVVTATGEGYTWTSALLGVGTADGVLELWMPKYIREAFVAGRWSRANLAAYRTVNPGFAARLGQFCESTKPVFTVDLPRLATYLGSTQPTKQFAYACRQALPKLMAAGLIKSWHIKKNVLTYERRA